MKEDTEKLIRELADKLGTTTDKLYSVLVKQSKVNIINDGICLAFFIAGLLVLFYLTGLVSFKDVKEWPDSNYAYAFVWLLNIVGWVSSFFVIPSYITAIISNWVNPEYSAIKDILYAITPYNDHA